jgi:hypothetical protein
MHNIFIVLNERAGSLLDRDPAAVKAELRRRLAGPDRTVDVLLAHKRGIALCETIGGHIGSRQAAG